MIDVFVIMAPFMPIIPRLAYLSLQTSNVPRPGPKYWE